MQTALTTNPVGVILDTAPASPHVDALAVLSRPIRSRDS